MLLAVASAAVLFVPAAWDSRTFKFQEEADGTFHAKISRFGKSYDIQRVESSGAGTYIEMTISMIEPAGKTAIATYSTCGHYRDEGTQLLFFEPHGFHCGLLTSRLDDLFTPRISRVEFSESGAVPSFLPQDLE